MLTKEELQIKTMNEFFSRIKQSPNDFCFLIGNGLNRYMMDRENEEISWLGYLNEIANKFKLPIDAPVCMIINKMMADSKAKNQNTRHCITNPEISSLLEDAIQDMEMDKKITLHNQACRVARYFFKWKENKDCQFLQYLRGSNIDNIFTINYEYNIERALGMIAKGHQFPKFTRDDKIKDQFHRVNKYRLDEYSTGIDGNPKNTKVWHLHGHRHYQSTILLSMTDYMSAISYIKNNLFFDVKKKNFINPCENKAEDCYCGNTWLYPFFNKPLVIIGCALGTDESFLRWLLLYRYRRQQAVKSTKHNRMQSYYLTTEDEDNAEPQDFIECLGIQPVVFSKSGLGCPSKSEGDFDCIYDNSKWCN